MIVNAYKTKLSVIPGTRLLVETLDLVGLHLQDETQPTRRWTIQNVYAPLPSRALGGIRVKLTDNKNYVTFCNQRDLEVLLGVAQPGQYCGWAECDYVGPGDSNWFGFCADEEDLLDDLYERELLLRNQMPGGILTPEYNIERFVHLSRNNDCFDVFVLLQDVDPYSGVFPDPRFETIESRWLRSERTKVRWERS